MGNSFLKDVKKMENADLVFFLGEMEENHLHGAVQDIKREMVRRFCEMHWSYIEELMEEDRNRYAG